MGDLDSSRSLKAGFVQSRKMREIFKVLPGFILNLANLENLEYRQFFTKSEGRYGIAGKYCIIFIKERESQGK